MAETFVIYERYSTLIFGDNEELPSFGGEDGAVSHIRVERLLFVMGDQDEFEMVVEEGEPFDYLSEVQPMKAEYIQKLEDIRVEDSGLMCSIRLDEMPKDSEVKCLPCCHMYHCNCIGEWLKKRNTCPLCRLQIPES